MSEVLLATLGGISVALALASGRLRDLPLSEPLVALAAGVVLGPGLGVLEFHPEQERAALSLTAEISVALAVMAAALRYSISEVRHYLAELGLLLAVVLPIMAAISGVLAVTVLGLPLAAAWLLGAILAPTDPVLAASVVTGRQAERDLGDRIRAMLSLESAANDGLAFVLVLTGMAAVGQAALWPAVGEGAGKTLLGVTIGGLLGWVAGTLLVLSERHHDIEHAGFLVLTVSLTLFVLGSVELVGGQGIVGVFAAGLAYNHSLSRSERSEEWEVQEAMNRSLVLPVFALLGAVLPWQQWRDAGWEAAAFAVAVLALRRLPALVAVRRPLRLDRREAAFVGWFGPIGVAALFYLTEAAERGLIKDRMWASATLVVTLSVVLHGLTSSPLRRRMAPR